MWFMNSIISRLNEISGFFYSIYLEVLGWIPPFWYAAGFFYSLHSTFVGLSWAFYSFNQWVSDVAAKVAGILSYTNIYSYFQSYFTAALNAWNWVINAFNNIWSIVDNWWSSAQYIVLAWIDDAKSYAASLVAGVNSWLVTLQGAWDSFKGRIPTIDELIYWWSNWTGYVLSAIDTWWTGTVLEVQNLLDSAFLEREPFWAGWQDWRDKVTEFFSDPEDWLYKAADRIIERFW